MPDLDLPHISIPVSVEPKTDSLLLGYSIGSAKLPHGRTMAVIASGKTVRFSISGIDGYVEADLTPIAEFAALELTKDRR